MNCTQVQELLPLYAGQDLAERREQAVTAHLQSCVTCSLMLTEYRELRAVMPDFAAPVFDDDLYEEIRQSVWQRIEKQSRWRSLFASVTRWYEPQFAWAAAAVVMIAVSLLALYFVNKTYDVRPTVIVDIPKIVGPAMGPAPGTRGSVPLTPGDGSPSKRQANMPKRQRRPDRMVAPDRGHPLATSSPGAEIATVQRETGTQPSQLPTGASETLVLQSPDPPVIGTDDLDLGIAAAEKALRMEIQTRNPNVRIIWFSQREPKPLTTPSKGI